MFDDESVIRACRCEHVVSVVGDGLGKGDCVKTWRFFRVDKFSCRSEFAEPGLFAPEYRKAGLGGFLANEAERLIIESHRHSSNTILGMVATGRAYDLAQKHMRQIHPIGAAPPYGNLTKDLESISRRYVSKACDGAIFWHDSLSAFKKEAVAAKEVRRLNRKGM